jgi:hypothetical protein
LAYPDYNQPFILATDASQSATGAILSQMRHNKVVVIAYGGRKFSAAEMKYTTTERECLAVIAGLKEFEPYIRGKQIKILTDHAALKWILTQKQPPGRLARWLAYMQSFNFVVEHRPGHKIPHADCISRQINDNSTNNDKYFDQPTLEITNKYIINTAKPPNRTDIDDFIDDKLLLNLTQSTVGTNRTHKRRHESNKATWASTKVKPNNNSLPKQVHFSLKNEYRTYNVNSIIGKHQLQTNIQPLKSILKYSIPHDSSKAISNISIPHDKICLSNPTEINISKQAQTITNLCSPVSTKFIAKTNCSNMFQITLLTKAFNIQLMSGVRQILENSN